jgi:putative colanic acid biosynthesis acetyltransferase WcaB
MNTKGIIFINLFRFSHLLTKNIFLRIIGFPYRMGYRFLVQWVLGIDIPDRVSIGKNFNVYHGQGIVIHVNSIIGDNVTLRQNTTLGTKGYSSEAPILGNNVDVGANVVILGPVRVGNNVIIGAGSVVVKDIPNDSIFAGNPAKFLKRNLTL